MNREKINVSHLPWIATGAVCSFGGGILAAAVGSVLTVIGWVIGAELHPWLRVTATVLLIVTIPLLIFAGYCMDWAEHKHLE